MNAHTSITPAVHRYMTFKDFQDWTQDRKREWLISALDGRTVTEAARAMQVDRSSIYRMAEQLGVSVAEHCVRRKVVRKPSTARQRLFSLPKEIRAEIATLRTTGGYALDEAIKIATKPKTKVRVAKK